MTDDGWPTMCPDCTCCRAGSCTTTGRWSGYCPVTCPCELLHNLIDDEQDDLWGDE